MALLLRDGAVRAPVLLDALIPDYAELVVDGEPAFASGAPWRANHDLLVEEPTGYLAGIVYSVARSQRSAVRAACDGLPESLVRYCIAPRDAIALLESESPQPECLPRDWGDPCEPLTPFPGVLRPVRQRLRACLLGETSLDELGPELREAAATHFRCLGDGTLSPGPDDDRVEVVWAAALLPAGLPAHFPSMLRVEPAQQFAEDIWLRRRSDDRLIGIALNHVDSILSTFGLGLPSDVPLVEARDLLT